jgi:putative ABC transport system permease protein
MDIQETFRMAVSTLVNNRLRSSLTMLGIVIGNASVIGMIGIGQGAQKLASDQFQSLGPNLLFIVPGSEESRRTEFNIPKTLVLEDSDAIKNQVPTAYQVAPQLSLTQVLSYGNQNTSSSVFGVTAEFLEVRSFKIAKGRFFNEIDLKRNNRVVVLGSEIASRFFGSDDPLNKNIRIKDKTFEVVGVMEAKGTFLGSNQDDAVFVPITTMANQLVGRSSPFGTQVSFISVEALNGDNIRAAKFQIENLLRRRHKINGDDDFTVRTQKDILTIVGTITSGLTALLAGIAAISLFVGGIGVMNIMLVSVTERTQEIGLRKAIGARESDILLQFLIEAVILSVVGGFLGIFFGVSILTIIGTFSPLKPGISIVAITISVGVSGSIGLFFGVVPAQRAAKLDPIVALRSI